MKTSEYGLALIKRFENCSLKPYLDAVNLWTVGYGHRISPIQVKQYWGGVTQSQAEAWLVEDVSYFSGGISKSLVKDIPQSEFDAVSSLVFNIGLGAFQTSHLLSFLNEGDSHSASQEFIKWCYAGGRVLPGLQKRRQIEQHAFDFAPAPGETVDEYLRFVCGQQ